MLWGQAWWTFWEAKSLAFTTWKLYQGAPKSFHLLSTESHPHISCGHSQRIFSNWLSLESLQPVLEQREEARWVGVFGQVRCRNLPLPEGQVESWGIWSHNLSVTQHFTRSTWLTAILRSKTDIVFFFFSNWCICPCRSYGLISSTGMSLLSIIGECTCCVRYNI